MYFGIIKIHWLLINLAKSKQIADTNIFLVIVMSYTAHNQQNIMSHMLSMKQKLKEYKQENVVKHLNVI